MDKLLVPTRHGTEEVIVSNESDSAATKGTQ